jgi:hypothetical protein
MTSILSKTWLLNGLVGGVLFYNMAKLYKMAKLLKMEEIGVAIGKAWAAAFSGPASIASGGLLGLAVGAGLTAAIMSSVGNSSSMNDGVMGPDGKVLYSKQEGAIKLNKKDTVVTGTNLFGNTIKPNTSNNTDSSGMIAAINSLHQTLTQKNFNPVVRTTIGGSEVAITSVQNSFNMA